MTTNRLLIAWTIAFVLVSSICFWLSHSYVDGLSPVVILLESSFINKLFQIICLLLLFVGIGGALGKQKLIVILAASTALGIALLGLLLATLPARPARV